MFIDSLPSACNRFHNSCATWLQNNRNIFNTSDNGWAELLSTATMYTYEHSQISDGREVAGIKWNIDIYKIVSSVGKFELFKAQSFRRK